MTLVKTTLKAGRMVGCVVCTTAAISVCMAGANDAQADTVFKLAGSDSPVGSGTADSLNVGLNIADQGDAFEFTFTNASTVASSITKIWFERGLFATSPQEDTFSAQDLSDGPLLVPPSGSENIGDVNLVDKSNASSLANVPKLLGQEDWEGTAVAFLAKGLSGDAGINQDSDDAFSVTFDKRPSALNLTGSDIASMLTTPGTRIGVLFQGGQTHPNRIALISFAPDQQPQPSAVPSPAAFAAGALLLMGLGATRRRRG